MIRRCDVDLSQYAPRSLDTLTVPADASAPPTPAALAQGTSRRALAQVITALETGRSMRPCAPSCTSAPTPSKTPTLGITGTGGAGKSSLTDELVRRFRLDQDDASDDSRSSRSTRPGASRAVRCSATASG